MKTTSTQTIEIELMPFMRLLGVLIVISILSCLIIWYSPLSIAIRTCLIILVVITTGYYILRDVLLRLPWSWLSIKVNAQGQLILINRRGEQYTPVLATSTFIHSFLIILNFERSPFGFGLPSLILFANTRNQQQHRLLRVYLRWKYHVKDNLSNPASLN